MAYQYVKIGEDEVKLTDKELLFVEHYLTDKNGTQAAIRSGTPERSARVYAAQILTKPSVQKYIQYKSGLVLEAIGVDQIRIAQELAKLAFSDITDYMEGDYQLKPLDGLDKRKTGAIATAKVQEREFIDADGNSTIIRTKEIKLHDKLKALERLADMAGMTSKGGDQGKEDDKPSNFFTQINNYYKS